MTDFDTPGAFAGTTHGRRLFAALYGAGDDADAVTVDAKALSNALGLIRALELAQQHGFFHAGALTTLADTAAGYAAFTLMPEDAAVLTVEFKMNLLRPGRGAAAVARAEVLKPGRTLMAVRAAVFCRAADGGAEELAATMLATMMCVRGRPDVPPG